MTHPHTSPLLLTAVISTLLTASGGAHALFAQGPGTCKNDVAGRYSELSMADISVSRAYDERHGEAMVDWSVNTESLSASGTCKINEDGNVLRLKVEKEKRHSSSGGNSDTDGFYYDQKSGHWRQSDTSETCHSCTPENGFPQHGGSNAGDNSDTEGFYYDRRSGHWRQSDNDRICHSCTPENGFPRHGG